MLGILDSGLGGLGVAQRLHELLPAYDLLYFADQAHVPYGDRPAEELSALFASNVAWLNAAGASLIVMGCNTSCAVAQRFGWPSSAVPILDLIDAAAAALQQRNARRIGVVATSATVAANAYRRAIARRLPDAQVWEVAAPALVPIVEAGAADTPQAYDAVAEACARLPEGLDAYVHGCTHYPLLDRHFAAILGDRIPRIDPAAVQAERAAAAARQLGLAEGRGGVRYVTTGDRELFRDAIARIVGGEPDVRAAAEAAA
ncbi:MAG: glutamate racemase [Candidatus Eremiobacteraeota bacterium]|nr:glutamate racemase [Candidatus Eremiobacteraeota bacterium]